MTSFTRNWNTSYEQSPPDSQDLNQGALRIREDKIDVRERLAIDHIFADGVAAPNSEDGYHNKSSYKKQGSDPSVPTDYGVAYVKDHNNGSNTKPELHYRNVDGQILRLTERGSYPLFLTQNSWPKSQATPQVNGGTGSGDWTPDASLSNTQFRTINGTSGLLPPINGIVGQVLLLRIIQSGGTHTFTLTGKGHRGSPDIDYASSFPGETYITMHCVQASGPPVWDILSVQRQTSSAV
jgi:hypothetical protein